MNPNNPARKSALVVEDRPTERERIGQSLEQLNLDWVPAENLDTAQAQISKEFAIMVLDLLVPPHQEARATLAFLRDFRRVHPIVPIIILSVHQPRPEEIREVVAARAGYLFRKAEADLSAEELTSLLKLALAGTISYSQEIAGFLPSLVEHAFQRENPLTKKEWTVLPLLYQGLSPDQIGQRLAITAASVRTHKRNMLDKLFNLQLIGVHSDRALFDWFHENQYKFHP
ncbi:MAG: response regulator transcription factor [Chloroflexi bacterium]|nr:response regulator transcription factor [Chloroflexota bacterium]